MEKVKHERKIVKPKNRFTLCCFCLGSADSDVDLNTPFERHEAYDYVVEKLAIKRVPISLFATDEDLAEMQNGSISTTSSKSFDMNLSPRDKRSATVFSSYYKMIQRSNNMSRPAHLANRMKKTEAQSKLTRTEKVFPNCTNCAGNVNNSKPTTKGNKKPAKRTKEITQAEVHKDTGIKKDTRMTPELQETIHALGTKRRSSGSLNVNHRKINRNNGINVKKQMRDLLLQEIINPGNKLQDNNVPVLHYPITTKSFPNKASPPPENRKLVSSEETLLPSTSISNDMVLAGNPKSKKFEELNSLINDIVAEAGSSKSASSQKWKIIIKEHDKDESTTPSTAANTPESGTQEDLTEEEVLDEEAEESD